MAESNYERLMTLAKQDYERRVKELNISELDEILYESMEYAELDCKGRQKFIARKVFRPVIGKYSQDPEKWLEYLQSTCGEQWNFQIEINPDNREILEEIIGKTNASGDLLKVNFELTETIQGTVYGFTGNKKTGLNVIGIKYPELNVVDLGFFFAGIYMYCETRKELERLAALSEEERLSDANYGYVLERFAERRKFLRRVTSDEEMLDFCWEKLQEAAEWRNASRKKRLPFNLYRILRQSLATEEEKRFHSYMFRLILRGKWSMPEYVDMVDFSLREGKGWLVNQAFYPFFFMSWLSDAKARERGVALSNFCSYRKMNSDYARSFMTKKNRSAKLQEQTEESILWKYFGYVEYDTDGDVEVIRQYEAEFEHFYESHLKGIDLSGNAIRFRKLGQHNASGLYYPQVKCLCVDIHNPHSMIHELGHLLDYQMGGLSGKREFASVYQETKRFLTKLVREKDILSGQLGGRTKYNLSYYLTPTEVFARAFELYAYYEWGERSNLLKEKYDGVYDTSEKYLSLVRRYFGEVWKNHPVGTKQTRFTIG